MQTISKLTRGSSRIVKFWKFRFSQVFVTNDQLKMAEDRIDALDERLTQLERRIFGLAEKDAEYPKVRS